MTNPKTSKSQLKIAGFRRLATAFAIIGTTGSFSAALLASEPTVGLPIAAGITAVSALLKQLSDARAEALQAMENAKVMPDVLGRLEQINASIRGISRSINYLLFSLAAVIAGYLINRAGKQFANIEDLTAGPIPIITFLLISIFYFRPTP